MENRQIHEPVPIKRIKLWDDSNTITHSGEPLTYREVVLTESTGANGTVFNLPKPIRYCKKVMLQELNVPSLFFNITSTQTLVQSNNTGALTSVVLTAGVYTQADIIAAFAAAGDSTIAFSTITGLVTITFAASDPNHTLDFTSATQLQALLGFSTTSTVQAGTAFTGDVPPNLYPINSLYVRSNALTRLYVDNVLTTTSAADQNVAFTVPMTVAPSRAYYFYSHPNDRHSMSCHGGDMQEIDITITDQDGNVLDMHSQPYTIKFAVQTEDFQRR